MAGPSHQHNNYGQLGMQAYNAYHTGDVYFGASNPDANNGPPSFKQGFNLMGAPELEDSLFIGREAELQQMTEILRPGQPATRRKILVIGGMGGLGKTQLAISYSKHFQNLYSSIFWLNATSATTLKEGLKAIADKVFPLNQAKRWTEDEIPSRISKWLSENGNNSWLLILDNYDEPTQYDITKFYPYTSQGSIIITTRVPDNINGIKLKLKMISDEDGLLILQSRTYQNDLSRDDSARGLARRLAGFPLALASAGSFINKTGVGFDDYLQEYQDGNLHSLNPIHLPEYQWNLFNTWNISFAQLQREDPNAAKLLSLLAYFDNQDIWYELLVSHPPVRRQNLPSWFQHVTRDYLIFATTMGILAQYCFVEVQPHTRSYSLHNCVHDWISNVINKSLKSEDYWIAAECVSLSIMAHNESTFDTLKHGRFTPHAIRLGHTFLRGTIKFRDQGGVIDMQGVQAIRNMAFLLVDQRQFTTGEMMHWQLLSFLEQNLGPNHFGTLDTVFDLGTTYERLGNMQRAEQMFRRALTGMGPFPGSNHRTMLRAASGLARIYFEQGNLQMAEQLYQLCLTEQSRLLGPVHIDTLVTARNVGIVYERLGKLEMAEQLFQRVLIGGEQTLGINHPYTLGIVSSLAIVYCRQGRMEIAKQQFERALTGQEQLLGPNHKETRGTAQKFALLYRWQGEEMKAKELDERFNLMPNP